MEIIQEKVVSIHPMLLFILNRLTTIKAEMCVNTSHVTVHLSLIRFSKYLITVSIHPMLLFIHVKNIRSNEFSKVSIHPMLLFIKRYLASIIVSYCVSIHPMLLFIQSTLTPEEAQSMCQYIPCYCSSYFDTSWNKNTIRVSIHPMLLFIM